MGKSTKAVTEIWLQWPFPDRCDRCDCCSADLREKEEAAFCAGRCDDRGHHHDEEGIGEVYNNEPCWQA